MKHVYDPDLANEQGNLLFLDVAAYVVLAVFFWKNSMFLEPPIGTCLVVRCLSLVSFTIPLATLR